jgi:hypothetical protein
MMIGENNVLASSLPTAGMTTRESCSIVFVSRDNKSFAINLVSSIAPEVETDNIPGSVIASDVPIEGFKVLCRIVSDQDMSKNVFKDNARCKVIANSLEDKLKAYRILAELESCL